MKRSLIIVIIVAVAILGILVLLKPGSNLQNAADQTMGKLVEASLRGFVAGAMSDMFEYYSNEKNKIPYWENTTNKQILDARIAELESRNGGEQTYRVLDEKENAAVKAADISRGIYVCMDSLTAKTTIIVASEFDKNTDCAGQVLK